MVGASDNYIDYSYDLRPNYELKQELLRISNQIRIMEPVAERGCCGDAGGCYEEEYIRF